MPYDKRITSLGIQIGNKLKTYKNISFYATGTKFSNVNQGQAEVKILNLNRDERERLMTECSPFNTNPARKSVIIEAGVESTGTSVLYQGDIFRVSVSGKPDVALTLRCLTGNYNKNSVVAQTFDKSTDITEIAKSVAEANGLDLSFEGIKKKIGSVIFNGTAFDQLKGLDKLTDDDVYVDDKTLVIKEKSKPRVGSTLKILNKGTGMIGVPESTENGLRVTMLYDPGVSVGSRIRLKSELSPILDGDYVVFKLDFDISSRDKNFYLIAEARRL